METPVRHRSSQDKWAQGSLHEQGTERNQWGLQGWKAPTTSCQSSPWRQESQWLGTWINRTLRTLIKSPGGSRRPIWRPTSGHCTGHPQVRPIPFILLLFGLAGRKMANSVFVGLPSAPAYPGVCAPAILASVLCWCPQDLWWHNIYPKFLTVTTCWVPVPTHQMSPEHSLSCVLLSPAFI